MKNLLVTDRGDFSMGIKTNPGHIRPDDLLDVLQHLLVLLLGKD
jgi:hypothetical protein